MPKDPDYKPFTKAYQDRLCQLTFLLGLSRDIQLQCQHGISFVGKYMSCYQALVDRDVRDDVSA